MCVCVCVLVGGLHFCVHGDDPNYNLPTDQHGQAETQRENVSVLVNIRPEFARVSVPD